MKHQGYEVLPHSNDREIYPLFKDILDNNSSHEDYLNFGAIIGMHKQMFGETWENAGVLRPIGWVNHFDLDSLNPGKQIEELCKEIKLDIKNKTHKGDPFALLAKLHYKLFYIHPFIDGNGRITRVITTLLARELGFEIAWNELNNWPLFRIYCKTIRETHTDTSKLNEIRDILESIAKEI